MRKIYSFVLLTAFFAFTHSQAQTPFDWWVTNGTVSTIAQSGNTVYLGGAFTYVGPNIPYGAALDAGTGAPNVIPC